MNPTFRSDKPGKDAQESVGASLRLDHGDFCAGELTSITAFAISDIDFSFDADWGNDRSWAPYTYDFVSNTERRRTTVSQEIRLVSKDTGKLDWIAGVYYADAEDRWDAFITIPGPPP